jgi:type II secretory pathway component PulM
LSETIERTEEELSRLRARHELIEKSLREIDEKIAIVPSEAALGKLRTKVAALSALAELPVAEQYELLRELCS